ncbi:NAD-dependent epimerase/dehydratase [Treponema primitia ZAS-2]|uniref:NAD-dependent epimerase/dehydratase n=1 Tax=Treponema primitia (strain ATCC BAA-887 / DSM 12427 / ZAS-2) TaxID=545694 RepID=F5YNZ6_TREPZ|nr:NAD-dependent epimerase/dehydratase family protein [Treponema primitia]AEF86728.1 NAD-dependent epimerase/dehydratase [Treponema primitia ZAS-2]
MNILITGIHGFVGSNLVRSLENHTIYGLSTRSPFWENLNGLPPIDCIIHLAGKAHDTKNITESEIYFNINTELTKKIFDYFLQTSAKKFIYFSSVKAVADTVDTILTEDAIPLPIGPYGESKYFAEEYIRTVSINASIPNKQVYILRPCMIHGPGNKGNLNLLYNIINLSIPWPLGSFDNNRSFTSIDNLIYIINKLLEHEIASGVYNVADDEALSTNEIIQCIGETIPRKCKILYINKRLMAGVARLGDIFHLPLNQERLKKLTENYIVSNEKIKKALSIDYLPLSAKNGLIKTIQSFKSESIQR